MDDHGVVYVDLLYPLPTASSSVFSQNMEPPPRWPLWLLTRTRWWRHLTVVRRCSMTSTQSRASLHSRRRQKMVRADQIIICHHEYHLFRNKRRAEYLINKSNFCLLSSAGSEHINRVVSHPTEPLSITAHENRTICFLDNKTGICSRCIVSVWVFISSAHLVEFLFWTVIAF